MKKIIFMLTALFLSHAGMAQTADQKERTAEINEPGKVSFGFRAGYTRFTIGGADVQEFSPAGKPGPLNGYYAGIEMETKLNAHFWLKHSLYLIQKGALLKLNDSTHGPFDSKYKNNYLEIAPLMPSFHWKGLQAFAGPYASVLLSSSIERQDDNGRKHTDRSIFGDAVQEKDYTQKLDAGMLAGLEYGLKNGLNIGLRYSFGLVPLLEDSGQTAGQMKLYNRGFSVTLGYTLSGK